MFRFADPYYLFLLPTLIAAGYLMLARRSGFALPFAPTHYLPPPSPTWRTAAANAAPLLFLTGLAFLIVALARPQTVLSKTTRHASAIAIQMTVDVSGSMDALDFSSRDNYRSRLDVVKETFARFIEGRPHDLIGLVTFGGYASSLTPLTLDHKALLHTLKGVHVPKPVFDTEGNVLNQEELLTAIGDALATACARLEPIEIKSKIIVLLSDGESNTGIIKPEEAIKAARKIGIKIYTIGVGSTGKAPFLAQDVFGRNTIQYAEVRMDEDLLRKIADTTGGKYFNVLDPKGLARAMAEIDKLERTDIRNDVFTQYNELFAYFLLPGACLLVLAILFGVNARKELA